MLESGANRLETLVRNHNLALLAAWEMRDYPEKAHVETFAAALHGRPVHGQRSVAVPARSVGLARPECVLDILACVYTRRQSTIDISAAEQRCLPWKPSMSGISH